MAYFSFMQESSLRFSSSLHGSALFCHDDGAVITLAAHAQITGRKVSTYRRIAANNMKSARRFKFTAELNMVHILQNKRSKRSKRRQSWTWMQRRSLMERRRTFSRGIFFLAQPSQIIGYLGQISSWAYEETTHQSETLTQENLLCSQIKGH